RRVHGGQPDGRRLRQRRRLGLREPPTDRQPPEEHVPGDLGVAARREAARRDRGENVPLHQRGLPLAERRVPADGAGPRRGRSKTLATLPRRSGVQPDERPARRGAVSRVRPRPAGLLPALHDLPFVCPGCRGRLEVLEASYRCPNFCNREFPLHGGIPDFRIFPDPYLGFDADRERTDRVLAVLDELPFPRLLEKYWSLSDETPEPLRAKFVESALRGEDRAGRLLSVSAEAGLPDPGRA